MTGGPSSRDRLGDYSTDRRILLLTSMAAAVGVISAFVALALVRLIGLFTNLAYFHRFATLLTPPAASGLGLWAVPIPVIGGVIVGLMARYGSFAATASRRRSRRFSSGAAGWIRRWLC